MVWAKLYAKDLEFRACQGFSMCTKALFSTSSREVEADGPVLGSHLGMHRKSNVSTGHQHILHSKSIFLFARGIHACAHPWIKETGSPKPSWWICGHEIWTTDLRAPILVLEGTACSSATSKWRCPGLLKRQVLCYLLSKHTRTVSLSSWVTWIASSCWQPWRERSTGVMSDLSKHCSSSQCSFSATALKEESWALVTNGLEQTDPPLI